MKTAIKNTGLLKLALLLIGLPALVWLGGVRRTVEVWKNVRTNRMTIISSHASLAAAKFSKLGLAGRTDSLPPFSRHEELLEGLSETMRANHLRVERYTPYLIGQNGEANIYACEILIRGRFTALTRLIDAMERDEALSDEIVSTDYRTVINNQNKQKHLQLTLVIQQITRNNLAK